MQCAFVITLSGGGRVAPMMGSACRVAALSSAMILVAHEECTVIGIAIGEAGVDAVSGAGCRSEGASPVGEWLIWMVTVVPATVRGASGRRSECASLE